MDDRSRRESPSGRRADRRSARAPRPKDRVIQARVPEDLESTLKREARRRRLTVSHLIRNVLEDTFELVDGVVANVDDIVNDSVELARRVGRDARRVAGAMRDAVAEPEAGVGDAPEAERGVPGVAPAAAATRSDAGDEEPARPPGADPLEHVFAWNAVVPNREVHCRRCDAAIPRGGEAWVGLSEDASQPRVWLCASCREAL